jgi:hypothetical protein
MRYSDDDANPLSLGYKDPSDEVWKTVDWSEWLASGETIASVAWTVPTGLTQAAASNTSTLAKIKLSGGTAGVTYRVACKVTTSLPQVCERSFLVTCKDR